MRSYSLLALVSLLLITAVGCTKNSDPVTTPEPVQQNNNNGDSDENSGPSKAELSFVKKTRPVFFEMTSTGCPGCGGWGKPTFAKLAQQYGEDITPVAVHIKYGDPMITTESTAIWDNIDGNRFTPMIFVQDENAVIVNGGYIQQESEANAIKLLDEALMTEQPALAANIQKADDKWTVTYGAKFIDMMATGEYSLSCYLIEDGIVHQQSNYANNPATHDHVIRTSSSGAFGNTFSATDLEDNEVSWVSELSISGDYNKDNLYITLVLWKKTNGRYAAINGTVVK